MGVTPGRPEPPRFGRRIGPVAERFTVIGEGEIGGKAAGLALLWDAVATRFDAAAFPWADVDIPRLSVVATGVYEAFVERNGLGDLAASDLADERIAHAFQRADLPAEVVGDLKALIDQTTRPLAVRSSSLLEDALYRPFAGVYGTKMIPNNQPERDTRFHRLVEAIKFVYSSTWFRGAKDYLRAAGRAQGEERMAVVLQEVVGDRRGERYYPDLSGVARSFNFFPMGKARPEEGVVTLALGLGRTIVEGGSAWSYSPAHPKSAPPFGSPGDMVEGTQLGFWSVNLSRPPVYDPTAETEYLLRSDLAAAEADGTLDLLASTYDAGADRLRPGLGTAGPRVLTFAPLLVHREYPLNDLIVAVLRLCEEAAEAEVEIEFAATFPPRRDGRVRFALLQVRPMVAAEDRIEIAEEEMQGPSVLLASRRAVGNGRRDDLADIVYVKPQAFEARHSRAIAAEVDQVNRSLAEAGLGYLLIGFGRWGSADPWLGIPVNWAQIAGARAIVEASLPNMNVEPSQGSHFFHNLTSFGVSYLTVPLGAAPGIDWAWLDAQPAAADLTFVRHVHLERPLRLAVDGRGGRAAAWHSA